MTDLKLILIINFCVKSPIMSCNRRQIYAETLIKIAHKNILFGTVLDYEKENFNNEFSWDKDPVCMSPGPTRLLGQRVYKLKTI